MDVLLELAHVLGAERMGDGFPFPSVLGSVSCVEESALDADEGVVVVAGPSNLISSVNCLLKSGPTYLFKNPFPCP